MNQKPLWAATLVVGITILVDWMVPVPRDIVPQGHRISQRIPPSFGGWTFKRDLPVAQMEREILGTDDILHRVYGRSGGDEVLLTLVFSGGHRHSMHPPEVCYQSGGYTLVSRGAVQLEPDCGATVLRIMQGADSQLVNYWFYSKGRETASYIWHQIHLVLNQVLFRTEPSVLLRMSTRIENSDVEASQGRLSDFAQAAIPALRKLLSE